MKKLPLAIKIILLVIILSIGAVALFIAGTFGYIYYQEYASTSAKLQEYVKTNNMEKLKKLKLSKGVNGYYDGYTPLIYAIQHNNIEAVKYFISKGADVDLKAEPLSSSFAKGLFMCRRKNPPLLMAIHQDNQEIIDVLIQNGANVNAIGCGAATALHIAVQSKNIEATKKLLQAGADVNAIDERDETPLSKNLQDVEMVNLLKSAGAKENIFAFIHRHDLKNIKRLIKEGVDVKSNIGHKTIMTHAVEAGDVETIKTLIEAGADINVLDKTEDSFPLKVACDNGKYDIVKILVDNGADVNLKNKYNRTALILHQQYPALAKEYLQIIKILLENKAEVNVQEKEYGSTPLISAIPNMSDENPHNLTPGKDERFEIVKILIEAGADVNAKSSFLGTPLKIAKEYGNTKIEQLLIAHGAKK